MLQSRTMSEDTDKTGAIHTAGPWRACGADREDGCSCGQVWSISRDVPVAEAYREIEEMGVVFKREVVNANARLIAASPALLEACEADEYACALEAHPESTLQAPIARARATELRQVALLQARGTRPVEPRKLATKEGL